MNSRPFLIKKIRHMREIYKIKLDKNITSKFENVKFRYFINRKIIDPKIKKKS